MKKLLILGAIAFMFASCKKEFIPAKNEVVKYVIECESCTIQINDKYYTTQDYSTILTEKKEYVKLTTTKDSLIYFKLMVNNKKYSGYISQYVSFEIK